ncbi:MULTISPECIES: GNAT family N-acetyltransferase [Methylomonas]|uniref:GCN5 family acetyltransferase n=1 Tax=Methylomonas koyamae TaxID=702114 RepID=A0A177NQI0_9GAMM|nr:GNAT family N-acetyltransferase [Methylomonas koyamae]OAI20151.1 GCN5 family acetyltransferase [Methylomonas koyamae]
MTEVRTLATARLILRQWRDADRPTFAAINADARVMAHLPQALDRAASDALAERLQALIAEHGWGFWAVELTGSGEFIGYVGLHEPATRHDFAPCVEVGWRLAYRHWRQGYASEAARAALAFGFEILSLPEIVSFTALGNARSEAVMRRLGMRRDREFDHPLLPANSPLRRHVLYRLADTEWRRRSAV